MIRRHVPPAIPPGLAGFEVDAGPGSPRRREAAPPVGSTWLFALDPVANVLREEDPRGNAVERVYNALDQVVEQRGPALRGY